MFFSAITSLLLAHIHVTQEPSCTHANSSLAAEIWHNHTSIDPNQRGYVGLKLHLFIYLFLAPSIQVYMTPTDFSRAHSKGLLYPTLGEANVFPLKLHPHALAPPPPLPSLSAHLIF